MPPSPPSGPGHPWPPHSPRPGWGPPPDHGRPPALNGFALASLLVGLLCLPPLGIVFGIVALVQIAGKGERGKALAIVGLVVSVVTTGALVLTADRVATAVRDRFDAAGPHEEVAGRFTDLEDLRTGDCFNVPGGNLMGDRPPMYTVDCAEEHHGEVSSSGPFDPAGLPGSEQAERDAEEACWKAQDAYAMDTWALPERAEMYFYAPSRESWRRGDRQLLCVIGTTEEEQRGSLRRDEGMLTPAQVSFLKAANEVDLVLGRSPEAEPASALPEHRSWAREVYTALGKEVTALEGARTAPGMEKAVEARLKEVGAARAAWLRASQAPTPNEFDKQWDRAASAMSVRTEQALRGAYGLSTRIPPWLEGYPAAPDGSSGRGPASERV
ncbi:DUF4190 domain-containing protein [Streptomyces sp. NPDC058646]|uniref:DUF4190 domain-containing protein n=1 Tax=Streptomyces sp. NPDC058646 TaxID=3346574 RepID=UPI00365AEBC9